MFDSNPNLRAEDHDGPADANQYLTLLHTLWWGADRHSIHCHVRRAPVLGFIAVTLRSQLNRLSHGLQVLNGVANDDLQRACLSLEAAMAELDGMSL